MERSANLVEHLHQQNTLVVSPRLTLKLPISDTPRHLIRLVEPPTVIRHSCPRLLTDDSRAARLVKVLHSERRWLENGWLHQNVTIAISDGHCWRRRRYCDTAA